jgi:PucR family transcriptional regulator, proline-responsive transcriptional activator
VLSVNLILNKLNFKNFRSSLISDEQVFIKGAKLLSKHSLECDPEILFITKASHFLEIPPQNRPKNILCIEDCPISTEIIDNNKFNIIIIDKSIDLEETFNKVLDIIIMHQKIDHCASRFINALIECKGIQHIIDIGFEILGNPLFVTDANHKVLAYTKNIEVVDPDWNTIIENGYVSFNVATHNEIKECFDNAKSSRAPFICTSEDRETSVLHTTIRIDDKVIGFLTVPGYFKPFDENVIEIAGLLSNTLSLEMQKNKFLRNSKGIMYEYFITDLLDGKIHDRETIEERIKFLNWNAKANIYVLTIRAKNYETENVSITKIVELLNGLVNDSISVLYNNDIVLIINLSKKISQFETNSENLINFLIEKQLFGSMSRCFHSLADIRYYYHQSIRALELGFHMDKHKVLYIYENYTIYDFMAVCGAQKNLKEYCHPSLFLLAEYDFKNCTDFMQCLYTYLVNNKNLVESANILHVHRNTLSYRIEKIIEIMNIDIKDNDISFHLLLSFKILGFTEVDVFYQHHNNSNSILHSPTIDL